MLGTILIIVLILLLIGAIPGSPVNYGFGNGLNGGLGIVLVILIILALTGTIHI